MFCLEIFTFRIFLANEIVLFFRGRPISIYRQAVSAACNFSVDCNATVGARLSAPLPTLLRVLGKGHLRCQIHKMIHTRTIRRARIRLVQLVLLLQRRPLLKQIINLIMHMILRDMKLYYRVLPIKFVPEYPAASGCADFIAELLRPQLQRLNIHIF